MSVKVIRTGDRDGIRHEYWTRVDLHIVKLNGEVLREFEKRRQARAYIKLLLERAQAEVEAREAAAKELD